MKLHTGCRRGLAAVALQGSRELTPQKEILQDFSVKNAQKNIFYNRTVQEIWRVPEYHHTSCSSRIGSFTFVAKRSELRVSEKFSSLGETLTNMSVLLFPPREFWSK